MAKKIKETEEIIVQDIFNEDKIEDLNDSETEIENVVNVEMEVIEDANENN